MCFSLALCWKGAEGWIFSFRFATLLAELFFLCLVRYHRPSVSQADQGWSGRSIHWACIEHVCLQGEACPQQPCSMCQPEDRDLLGLLHSESTDWKLGSKVATFLIMTGCIVLAGSKQGCCSAVCISSLIWCVFCFLLRSLVITIETSEL